MAIDLRICTALAKPASVRRLRGLDFVQRRFAVTVFRRSIAARRNQKMKAFVVALRRRNVQRRIAVAVRSGHIAASLCQQGKAVKAVVGDGKQQRRCAMRINCLALSPVKQKALNGFRLTVARRKMQRRISVGVHCGGVGTGTQQEFGAFAAREFNGGVQPSESGWPTLAPPFSIRAMRVNAALFALCASACKECSMIFPFWWRSAQLVRQQIVFAGQFQPPPLDQLREKPHMAVSAFIGLAPYLAPDEVPAALFRLVPSVRLDVSDMLTGLENLGAHEGMIMPIDFAEGYVEFSRHGSIATKVHGAT